MDRIRRLLALLLVAAAAPAVAAQASTADRIEAHIARMHAKLKITAAQEDQWTKVAQVMRDNANAVEPLVKDRASHAKTMTAVDDLNSYAAIADAHADGIKKLIPVFAALYASMSDAQKKEADVLFRHGDRTRGKHK